MREAIDKVVQTVTPLADKKKLPLVVEVVSEVDQLLSDRRRVEQILINLVNNAVKFTEQGEVRVKADLISESGVSISELKEEEKQSAIQNPKSKIKISIADTGIGIQPEDMDKLFKAFQQVDSGLARRYEGTGLGLSICKKLAGMLGGEIWAESKGLGKGSAFTLIFPLD